MSGISNPCGSTAGRKRVEGVKWEGEKTSWLGGERSECFGLI